MRKTLLFLLLFSRCLYAQTGVYINEFVTSNDVSHIAPNGENYDWIELYNTNATPVDLAGCYMTNVATANTLFRFTLTTGSVVIPANGYLLLLASGLPGVGNNHLNFDLSRSGGLIKLLAPDGTTIIDQVTYPIQRTDVSYGRLPLSLNTFKYFLPSSPGIQNNQGNAYNEILASPTFSHKSGFYINGFNLQITHSDPAASIYYTTDGSEPVSNTAIQSYLYKNHYPELPGMTPSPHLTRTYKSNSYTSTIPIADKSSNPNEVSMISSTWNGGPGYTPNYPVYKGTVVKAIAYKTGALPSDVVTNSFYFTPNGLAKFTIPMVSLAMQENFLFDYYNGIYTAGIDFDTWRLGNPTAAATVYSPANYQRRGDAFEFKGGFEYFKKDTLNFKQNVGVRIHGGTTRAQRAKSLRFYGRSKYGSPNELNHKFFDKLPYTSYKTIMLHNSGQDAIYRLIGDVSIHSMVEPLNFDSQNGEACVLMLNGEYWGIHHIRERYDKHFFSRVYGVDPDNLDMTESMIPTTTTIEEGDPVHYDNLKSYMNANSMQVSTHYDYVKTQLDIENVIDYYASQLFFMNQDWPENNIGMWRLKVPYSTTAPKGHDGKWRFYLWDIDSGASGAAINNNLLSYITTTSTAGTFFFYKLIQNQSFKNDFINRFADLLNTAFLPGRTKAIFDSFKSKLDPEIQAHVQRWQTPLSVSGWQNFITDSRQFLDQKPAVQITHIQSVLQAGNTHVVTLNVNDQVRGFVKINTINILPKTAGVDSLMPYPWTGSYFQNVPIKLTAKPKSGYKFTHWMANGVMLTDSVLTVSLTASKSYIAHFDVLLLSNNPSPTAKVLSQSPCGYSFKEWAATETAGTFPSNMKFVYLDTPEPGIGALIEGDVSGVYNHTTKTRINGLGTQGISFINTSSSPINPGYPNTRLGGAILALNTEGVSSVNISWIARTITVNPRKYKIRLQARVGDLQNFVDVLDANNQPIEYAATVIGDNTNFNVALPASLLNQNYIQLFWKYYYTGVGTSGARDQLGIDDIIVTSNLNLSVTHNSTATSSFGSSYITSSSTVPNPGSILYQAGKSVELLPGFNSSVGGIFKAEILNCNN